MKIELVETILVGLILAAALYFVGIRALKKKKSDCSGGCGGCSAALAEKVHGKRNDAGVSNKSFNSTIK